MMYWIVRPYLPSTFYDLKELDVKQIQPVAPAQTGSRPASNERELTLM